MLSFKKLNKELLVRYIISFLFIFAFFLPTLFIPRRLLYKFFYPFFLKIFLFFSKVRTINLSDNSNMYTDNNPVIYASNHKSFVDSVVVGQYAKGPFTFVMKSEMSKNIFFKIIIWKMGLLSLDRNNVIKQKKDIHKIIKMVNHKKYSIIYFPEGEYHFDKPVGRIKKGIAKLVRETKVDIIPVAIYGIENTFIYDKKLVWKNMYIIHGKPIKQGDYTTDDELRALLHNRIKKLYYDIQKKLESI